MKMKMYRLLWEILFLTKIYENFMRKVMKVSEFFQPSQP